MLKAYKSEKINKDLIEKVGEDVGEEMMDVCPEVLELIMSDEKFVQEIISDYSKKESKSSNNLTDVELVEEDTNITGVFSETKIESYLVGGKFDAAQFYVDVEGHPDERPLQLALEELAFFASEVSILGTYPGHPFRRQGE